MTQMILGKYRLLLELPDDEPVQTWLGCQEQAGALVYRVLKVPPEVATRKEHLRLFHGYARRAMLIDHGGVARTIEASVDGDSYYIVTELVRGESLPRLVERVRRRGERVMSMMTALQIAAAAADALHAAHANRDGEGGSRSVVHGELAPQHVMIGYSGEVKLIDLPVATASRAIKVDAHGTMTGDLAYMSPEQCMGESADNRSNVFSLAVILWELLTGRKLFEQRDPFDLMTAITEGPVLLPSKVNSDVPPFLDALLNKALQKDPKQRLSDCSKFARALRQVIQRVQGAGSELGLELLMVELFPDRAALWQEFGRAESLGDVYNIERAARELFDLAPLAPQESLRVTTDLDAELTSSQQPSDEFGLGGVIDDAFAMLSSNQSGPPIQQARAPLPPEPPPGLTVPSTDHDRTKVYNREDAKAAVSEETVVKPRPSAPRDDEDPFATLRHDSLGAEVESRSSDTGLDFSFEPTPPDPSVEVLFIDDVPGTEESTQPSPDPISWAPDAWEPERAQDEPDFGLDSSRSLEPSVALASDKVVVDSVMGAGLEFEPAPASASSLRRAARVGAPVPEAYDGDDAYGRWYFGEDEDDELFESAIPMEEVFSPDVVEADVPGAVKAIQGVESRPVLQIVRIRDGVAVESRTLRGLLKRYAPKGAKIKVKLNNKKAALEPNGAQGWIRRKNSLQAESLPLASKSIPMGVGDIIEVEDGDFTYRMKMFHPPAAPLKAARQDPRRDLTIFAVSLAVAMVLHGFLALGVVSVASTTQLTVQKTPPAKELFAEGRLKELKKKKKPKPKPKPKPKKPKPKPKLVEKKVDQADNKPKVPKAIKKKLAKRLGVAKKKINKDDSKSEQLVAALAAPDDGNADNIKDMVSNIDAVKNTGSASNSFNVAGQIAALEGGGVNMARTGGSGKIDDLTAGVKGGTGKLGKRAGAKRGKVRGKVRGVKALTKVQGSLSRTEVYNEINRHMGKIQLCYERQLQKKPNLAGKIQFEWTVKANGRVTGVREQSSTLRDAKVSGCIKKLILKMKFPKPKGGSVKIAFPFIFKSSS